MLTKLSSHLEKVAGQPKTSQFMRIGYLSKGCLYLLIGLLASRSALLPRAEAGGSYSALVALVDQPFGKFLLILLGIGLLGYVLRRFLQVALNPQHQKISFKQILQRLGYFMSGCSYLGVSYSALMLIIGLGESDDTLEDLASELFDQPFGNWLVGLIGLGIISVGLSYCYGAVTGSYVSDLKSAQLHHRFEAWVIGFGKVGVAARGIAFILIGAFFIEAAVLFQAQPAGGLKGSLQRLAELPYGSLWLGLIGLGLIAYSLYMIVAARYRRSVL